MTKTVDEAEITFFQKLQSLIGSSPPKEVAKLPRTIHRICGVDAAYSSEGNRVAAAAAVFADNRLEETRVYSGRFTFPYVSGLFFLHEGPFVVAGVRKLKRMPQLVCLDAHGIAHPRSKGLAMICGMVLRVPTIGIAKSVLIGQVSNYRNGLSMMMYNGRRLGYATSEPTRYWSPGFAVSRPELERVIRQSGATCLKALQEAHRIAKEEINLTT